MDDLNQYWDFSNFVSHEVINVESNSITKSSDYTSIQNPFNSDDVIQSKYNKESIDSKEVVMRVKKHDYCSKSVALRKDIINKSIMRAFTRYFRNLFEFDTVMHTISGWQYDSLKVHICQVFFSSGLQKLYLEQATNANDLGKFKVHCLL